MHKHSLRFFVVMLLTIVFTLSCEKTKEVIPNKKMILGVSISSYDDTYLDYFRKELVDYSKQFPEVEIISLNARADTGKQLHDVEQLIDMGADSLIIVPVNYESTYPMTDVARESNVNIVYTLSRPSYLPEDVYFVGSDNEEAGTIQMTELAKLIKNKGNIVVLMGLLTMEDTIKRTDAIFKEASKYPKINIVKKQTANWSRVQAKLVVSKWIKDGVKFDAVASNNDDMAIGAADALKEHDLLDEVIICGVDATPEGLRAIKNGEMQFTILQDAKKQAILSFDKAYRLFKGENVKQVDYVPFKLVNTKNYKDFI